MRTSCPKFCEKCRRMFIGDYKPCGKFLGTMAGQVWCWNCYDNYFDVCAGGMRVAYEGSKEFRNKVRFIEWRVKMRKERRSRNYRAKILRSQGYPRGVAKRMASRAAIPGWIDTMATPQ